MRPEQGVKMKRAASRSLAFAVCLSTAFAAGSRVSAQAPAAAESRNETAAASLIGEVLSPRNRMEEDLRVLTDEIGGRVTGSPSYEAALQWGVEAFRRAGVDSVRLESYDAPARWAAESASAAVVSPYRFPLRVTSFALAPSTPAGLTAPLVDGGTGRRADFEKLGGKGKGAIALVRTKPMKTLEDLFGEYFMGPEMVEAARKSGVSAILFLSSRPRDLLYRHQVSLDGTISPLPMALLAREDGLRLARLLEKGREMNVSLEIKNRIGGAWRPQNVVAEIRGREKPDEIVLLGAHLDSWELGTGALDNGVNCALVVEVARALAAGGRPRRTVRLVLFTGEELGLLGSRGYVASHRGEMDRHVAAIVHDIGDGRITGYYNNGRPELTAFLSRVLEPVASWGSNRLSDEALLGTDNFDFLLEGVPNLVASQEPERYLPEYHAESDTFDKVDFREARLNAAIAAVTVAGIANAAERPGPRQSRAQVAKVLEKSGIADQMKAYSLWADWESGKRGRKN
jgi:carboxypeptidase Q